MIRLTLYQRLKPEVIAGLECVGNQPYHCSVNNILDLLKSEQYYSDLTIEDVKNIIRKLQLLIFRFRMSCARVSPEITQNPCTTVA